MQMSQNLFQYMAFLETERGIRQILGTLTGTQEKRLASLREYALGTLGPADKLQLRDAMSGADDNSLTSEGMQKTSQVSEARWASGEWTRGAY